MENSLKRLFSLFKIVMKRISTLISNYKTRKHYRFAVQKEVFEDGRTIYTPMVKFPGVFSSWQQIVQITGYKELFLMDIRGEQDLTHSQCIQIIELYKEQLSNSITPKAEIIYEEV